MLYRGRRVAVIAQGPEAVSEANFLAGLCREVVYFGKPEDALDPRIVVSGQKPKAILGEASVSGLRAGGEDLPFDGVFIFREAAALSALLPGLEMDGAFIRVDRRMQTNLPGVFAAGDCTGLPPAGRQGRRRGLRRRHFRRNRLTPSVTAMPCQTFGVPPACFPHSGRQAPRPSKRELQTVNKKLFHLFSHDLRRFCRKIMGILLFPCPRKASVL